MPLFSHIFPTNVDTYRRVAMHYSVDLTPSKHCVCLCSHTADVTILLY